MGSKTAALVVTLLAHGGASCVPHATEASPSVYCADGSLDFDESDVDCGGSCRACQQGRACRSPGDCGGAACQAGRCVASWPFGRDGELVVHAGERVTWPAGSVHDLERLVVEEGGVLALGPGGDWTVVGVRGSVLLDGTIEGRSGEHEGGAFEARAPGPDGSPSGERLIVELVQAQGGRGSVGYGLAAHGNGGGGGGGAFRQASNAEAISGQIGFDAAPESGGRGGDAALGVAQGSPGAMIYGARGQDGASGLHDCPIGSGAGGGSRGRHGQPLYLKVMGSLDGRGVIDLRGQDGGDGGKGGGATNSGYPHCSAGGGGGGGAGGSGGKLVLRLGGELGLDLGQVWLSAGKGGLGGLDGDGGNRGDDGEPGRDGPPPDVGVAP